MFFTNTDTQQYRNPENKYTKEHIYVQGITNGKALDPKSNNISTEFIVREYFADTPILARIAYCESKFKQFDNQGNTLRGEVTPKDLGVMQINEYFHGDTANTLGIDLYTLKGNLEYAMWLYEKEGTQPWISSQKCWDTYNELARI